MNKLFTKCSSEPISVRNITIKNEPLNLNLCISFFKKTYSSGYGDENPSIHFVFQKDQYVEWVYEDVKARDSEFIRLLSL